MVTAANIEQFKKITRLAAEHDARLVAVSKTKPTEDILALYQAGQRVFGENYVQELVAKQPQLPGDIQWHFIGHLQTNKVKQIAPFVTMIHSVDNLKLLKEINKQALKQRRVIDCLFEVHIASEETKFGLDQAALMPLLEEVRSMPDHYAGVRLAGLMGMATNTGEEQIIRREFGYLRDLGEQVRREFPDQRDDFSELSMGMSGDYAVALEEGSTLIRIGSLLFGARPGKPA